MFSGGSPHLFFFIGPFPFCALTTCVSFSLICSKVIIKNFPRKYSAVSSSSQLLFKTWYAGKPIVARPLVED